MNKKVKGIVAVAVTAIILAGTLFACSRKNDTPQSTDSSLTTSVTKEEQSSKTNKTDKDKSGKTDKDKSDKSDKDKSSKTDKSDKTDKSNKDEVKESSTKSENQSGKSDKKPENKKPEQTKFQQGTKKNNVTQRTTQKQTQRQTQGTTKRQTQSTTQRQTQITTKSTTRSTTARPRPADKVEYKTETEDYSISYRTVDNYSSTGAESRVYQQGKNGTGRKTYKVKYVNGARQNAELVSDTVVTQAQDHIIERYVQTEAGGTKRVPKKYIKEIPTYKDFWFSNCVVPSTGELRQEWFDSAAAAGNHHINLNSDECQPTNWGGPQQKQVGTEIVEIDGYETIEVPAKYEWKH